jgi:hypothetical protein
MKSWAAGALYQGGGGVDQRLELTRLAPQRIARTRFRDHEGRLGTKEERVPATRNSVAGARSGVTGQRQLWQVTAWTLPQCDWVGQP